MHNAGCCSSLCVTGEKEQTLCQSNHSTEITVITTPYLKNNSNKLSVKFSYKCVSCRVLSLLLMFLFLMKLNVFKRNN